MVKLQKQYKNSLVLLVLGSLEPMHQWIIYQENIGTHLAIDEVALSQGEQYTNKLRARKVP
jgi:hypothetical protein